MEEKEEILGLLLRILIRFSLFALSLFVVSWAFSCLWNWFLAPFIGLEFSIRDAAGFMLFFLLFLFLTRKVSYSAGENIKLEVRKTFTMISVVLSLVGIGAIVRAL